MSNVAQKIVSPVNVEKRQEIDIRPGDTVKVTVKIPEGDGEFRFQVFEGIVLARKHGTEAGATFTVRKVISGVGVEKIFPLYSPMIDKIEITKRSKTRRAKLYHIRDKAAREIRRQMRRMIQVDISTGSDEEEKAEAQRKTQEEEEAKQKAAEEAEAQKAKEAEEQAAQEKEESSAEDADSQDQADEEQEETEASEEDKE